MAAKSTTLTATVYSFERLNNSVNGNPRFKVHTNEGIFITSSDHGFVYNVESGLNRRESRPATLTLTRAGRVEDLVWL